MLRGRQGELGRAAATLAGLGVGTSATAVVIDGDAGMGKSALLDAVAAASDATVLRGRGHALGSGVAYGPVAGALARYLHGLAEAERKRLVAGLGSLALLVEGIGEPPAAGDPELERARMFQAVGLLVSRLAAERPVLLCVDDLHWADVASVELLQHLVSELRTEAVGFVVAVRPGELAGRPEPRHLVAELLRLRSAIRVTVGPLDADAVAAAAADRLGGAVAPRLAADLLDLTGGVALAVDALLGDALATGSLVEGPSGWEASAPLAVPGYVVDLFARRLDSLDRHARSVVEALAVADGPLGTDDLVAVLGSESEGVQRAAGEAVAAGLLVPAGSGWEVGHPLVASAALDAMAVGHREGLHRAFVDLERLARDVALDERARHVVAAGGAVDHELAAEVLVRAGRRAVARGAADAGARWLAAAAERADAAGRAVAEVAALHLETADAWELRSDLESALAASSRAAQLLLGTDHAAASEAAAAAASLCWQLGRREADEWWATALEAAAAGGSMALLRARQRWLVSCMRQGRIDEARDAAELLRSAISEVEGEGGSHPSGEASVALEQARQRLLLFETLAVGRPVEALLADDRPLPPSLPLAVRIELEGPQLDALVFLGRFEEARRRAESLLRELGPQVSVNRLSWRPVAAVTAAHLASGAWDDAADALTAFEIEVPNARSAWAFWSGVLALRRGDVGAAREAVAIGRPTVGGSGLVMRHHELDAVAAYADLLAGDAPSVDVGQRADGYFAMSHVLRTTLAGEVLVREGRPAEAVNLVAGLRARSGPDTYPHAVAARIEALAKSDAVGLVAAADALDRSQVPFEAAVARIEAAELDRALVPARAVVRCAELFERLGAVPWATRARALGSETAVGRRATVPQLTRRELEVAELVAEGLTNGQVAERLHVSIRTVTSHLDHAYTKLGIGSRAALVAHVLRLPEPT